MKISLLFATISLLIFSACSEESGDWTLVAFDTDTAVYSSDTTLRGSLVKQFTIPFTKKDDDQTYSHAYVCTMQHGGRNDTIVVINPNDETFPDTVKCPTCRDIRIDPVKAKITDLHLPTDFVRSRFSGRFPVFMGRVRIIKN